MRAEQAHEYLQGAIARAADELNVGAGHGPVHHFHAGLVQVTVWSVIGAGVAGLGRRQRTGVAGREGAGVDPGGTRSAWVFMVGRVACWPPGANMKTPKNRCCALGQEAIDWWADRTQVQRCGTLVVANTRDLPDLRTLCHAGPRRLWM